MSSDLGFPDLSVMLKLSWAGTGPAVSAEPWLVSSGKRKWDISGEAVTTAIFGSVLLQIRAAVPVYRSGASVTVLQVILIGFVAVAFTNLPTSACLFITVCAVIIGDMG